MNFGQGARAPCTPLTKLYTNMTKRIILHFLMLAGLAAIEIAFAAGMLLLMVGIVFGMMAGCATIQEFIHIFF